MQTPPTIVFDLDGTLVDSAPDLTAALNHVMSDQGHGPFTQTEVRDLVGKGARALIERGLKFHGRTVGTDELTRLLSLFLDYYGAHIADSSQAYEGVVEVLEGFHDQGIILAVCTNKVEGLSRKLLGHLDLARFFPTVLGGDSLEFRKPDPRHLTETIRRAGGTLDAALMIGDSTADIGAAKAAGVPVIAVSFGYNDLPVLELGANLVIDHYRQLPQAAGRLLAHPALYTQS